ncbi:MAG: serine dehydratase subunit alpha family protein [Lachnospiraceae bacterium]|nr:serine dehydratase subunit alpha family protein [Lachnospiraceae bacterium]
MDCCSEMYKAYIRILEEELKPAMGCTEPIALAYAAATARALISELPEEITIEASGSLIKNVKSVYVPHTGHLKGIPAAVAAGIIAGDPDKELEVLSDVTEEQIKEIGEYMASHEFTIGHLCQGHTFDMIITLKGKNHTSKVRIADAHTNIIYKELDGKVLYELDSSEDNIACESDHSILTMKNIYDFVQSLNVDDVRPILKRQIDYNMAIAEEGLRGSYGANIGKFLLAMDNSIRTRAKAYAAAGSDARMNGCELPVVINSGSGNQGITASVPIVIYARELNSSEDTMYRALALSNLTAIHEKTPIGRLSAYCGAVSAGAGAGAGIAYLTGAPYEIIEKTVSNAISIISGMVCDGAKASCAAKIAQSIDTALLSFFMAKGDVAFEHGDGLVGADIEETINNIGCLAREGMVGTNDEIIRLMIK